MKRRRFLGLIPRFAAGQVFLPLITTQQLPWGGTVEFHCDPGESALVQWLVEGAGFLFCDWIYLNPWGELHVTRSQLVLVPGAPYVGGWFLPTSPDQLLRMHWNCNIPCAVSWASCVI